MSCMQNNVFNTTKQLGSPATGLSGTCSLSRATFVHMPALCIYPTQTLKHHKMPNMVSSFPKYKTSAPICLFGGKGNSRGENKAFSWDLLKDALKGLRNEKTIQDMLRDQMRQQEFDGDSGDGNPPGSGGGGSDGTEDEGFDGALDDILQVVLATLAFLFMYIYIIKGAELAKLARDYIKYLLGGLPSIRLKQVMDKWKRAYDQFSWTTTEESEDWLIRRIVTTPTWWHRPHEIACVIKKKMREQKSREKLKNIL